MENITRDEMSEVLQEVGEECGHDLLTLRQDAPLTWSLWNSFFFTFTVITTIGFGHMAPLTPWGRVFCITYAFIGVPLNGIVFASLADLFSSKVVNSQVRKRAERYTSWVGVAVDALLYLVPGMVIFLVLPAAVFTLVEDGWTYLDAFYFSFITLTTIGFGDHVAGLQEREEVWVWLYKILMVIWIIFGLGYIVMLITFIQEALKSKRVHAVERRLAIALKKHSNKLNANIHRDLKRFRTVMTAESRVHRRSIEGEVNKGEMMEKEEVVKKQHEINRPHDLQLPSKTSSLHSRFDMSRSSSESNLPSVGEKEKCAGLSSVTNINMFLDMVESIVEEHHATAVGDMEDEMRHIVEHPDNSPTEEDVITFGVHPQTLEAGHLNQGYLDDDDQPHAKHNPQPPHEMHRHDENKINDGLQNKLHSLFQRKHTRKTSLPENGVNTCVMKTPVGVECTSSQPHNQHSNIFTRTHHTSQSVPGRIKSTTDKFRPDLCTIFKNHNATHNGIHPTRDHTQTSNGNSKHHCGNGCIPECSDETQPTMHSRHSALRLFTHWLHPGDNKGDQHPTKTDHHQEDSEEQKLEYTRL
ncbi:Open rectifier potassium channel protein 1-like 3 [Homarus americanus]|uniref:Open rectifier potassium channel protein 1-like 3 n=2 Tax=Homarus americanus TaxID=6706 RepID=A0A8J5K7H9_HOMAM|nr:Open rectifier potassium channel protein 1-like 3 [Homarus americanus]